MKKALREGSRVEVLFEPHKDEVFSKGDVLTVRTLDYIPSDKRIAISFEEEHWLCYDFNEESFKILD